MKKLKFKKRSSEIASPFPDKCCGTCDHWVTMGDSPYCGIAKHEFDALHGSTIYCTFHHPSCKEWISKKIESQKRYEEFIRVKTNEMEQMFMQKSRRKDREYFVEDLLQRRDVG